MWLTEGHIDPVTHDRLGAALAQHDVPAARNKMISVLVSLGALLIGAGLLLFIASQWGESSPLARLAMLVIAYAATVAAATLARVRDLGTTSNGLWFLSSIAAGANIFLVGQIFNLPLTYWQGTLLWLVATLAAGWAAPSSAQGWLAVPLAILTLGWLWVPSTFMFDQVAFLFDPAGLKAALPLVGIGLIAVASLVRDTDFGWLRRPATAFGATLVAAPLTLATFHNELLGWVFEMQVTIVHRLIAVGASVLLVVAWRRDRRSAWLGWAGAVLALFLVLAPQAVVPISSMAPVSWFARTLAGSPVLHFVYVAAVFGLALGAIGGGFRWGVKALVNTGFAMVSVQLFAFYVVRVAGALPASVAVSCGGLLLVGGAIGLERKRRDLARRASEKSGALAEVVA